MPSEPAREHAVEQVDTEGDRVDERLRIADAHQVPQAIGGQLARGGLQRGKHLLTGLSDRQPADAVSGEADLDCASRALGAHRDIGAALHDAEQRLPLAAMRKPPHAAAHIAVRSTASRTTSGGEGSGGHTSRTIWMSPPSASWMAIAVSGVSRCSLPSYTERNVTPSSSTFGESENTWNPPESVSTWPSKPMNRCRPPSVATTSAPGRNIR